MLKARDGSFKVGSWNALLGMGVKPDTIVVFRGFWIETWLCRERRVLDPVLAKETSLTWHHVRQEHGPKCCVRKFKGRQ